MEQHREPAVQWTWRMGLPMPWGQTLEHPVSPLQLLEFPLAFTRTIFCRRMTL
jgi:hypothetical protein